MRKLFMAALCVAFSAVTALAGGIPNPAPGEGAESVLVDGVWYWLWQGALSLMY